MTRFRLSKLAVADLRSIATYTQNTWGKEQRNRYLQLLDNAFQQLSAQPELGRCCDEIAPGYRKYAVGRHLVFYKVSTDSVDVIRVLHQRMDVEAQLEDAE
jgi:toxin ParE1/3/4